MTQPDSRFSRRRFIKTATCAVASIPLLSVLGNATWAADLPPIPLDHPTAVALGYAEDASAVDTGKYPKYAAGQTCDNCLQYKESDAEWGTCTILPGFLVTAKGWCNVWVATPG